MIGAEGAAQLITTALADNMPAKLRELEDRLELEPGTLPDLKLTLPHEVNRLGLEDWPSLMVVAQQTRPGGRRVDITDAGAAVYAITYVFRVFTWVRGEGYADTDLARKRTVLAVREVLLGRHGLDPAIAYTDPGSIEESYSDLAVDDAGRTIAGAYTVVDLVVLEAADAPPAIATAVELDVDTATLPPHPAL